MCIYVSHSSVLCHLSYIYKVRMDDVFYSTENAVLINTAFFHHERHSTCIWTKMAVLGKLSLIQSASEQLQGQLKNFPLLELIAK